MQRSPASQRSGDPGSEAEHFTSSTEVTILCWRAGEAKFINLTTTQPAVAGTPPTASKIAGRGATHPSVCCCSGVEIVRLPSQSTCLQSRRWGETSPADAREALLGGHDGR
jgi:hypothetical protein